MEVSFKNTASQKNKKMSDFLQLVNSRISN